MFRQVSLALLLIISTLPASHVADFTWSKDFESLSIAAGETAVYHLQNYGTAEDWTGLKFEAVDFPKATFTPMSVSAGKLTMNVGSDGDKVQAPLVSSIVGNQKNPGCFFLK